MSDAVGQGGLCEFAFDGLVLLLKHVGECRADVCPDDALVVRVLVNVEKLDLIRVGDGAVDVAQGDLPRGLGERETARRAAGLDESRLRQGGRQLAYVAGVGAHTRRDGGRVDGGFGLGDEDERVNRGRKSSVHHLVRFCIRYRYSIWWGGISQWVAV